MSRGGIYVYRCRKPGAFLGWPIIGRHTAYVGGTTSFYHRHGQHMEQQPWSDLAPRCYRIPLPTWKPLLHAAETLAILLLWPVYNHSKNLWNPRRIDLKTAKAMRYSRDRRIGGLIFRLWLGVRTLAFLGFAATIAYAAWSIGHAR